MSEISVDKQFIELYVKNDVITINIINTLDTGNGGGSGSVQDVSVVSANGFAGTVANPTSSPDITISTTVTGLLKGNGTSVSAAVAGTDYAAASHTHAISDVTNLQTSLDGKAATSHTHAISDVTSLQTTLDGKAASSHTHIIGDVTGLQTALDGKAAASHTHAISEVTGLQTALDGKVAGNAAITGATKTKITYDSKGLVTAGADIAASDLPTGIDAAKIGTGVVSNTEFGYLDGLTSAIQTQLNAKASTSHTHTLDDLSDVTITTPSTNQVLKYNGTAWVNDASPAGATNLDGLTDVTITAAATGEYLRYNGTAWVDATIQAGDLPTGIDAAKLADGSISNTEFQYLNNVSSNIQTQLDGKVASNVGITGATKTKITYDAKGLVTAGADANLDDLGDVVITSPTSSQILSYNGTNWVNSTPSAGATGDMNSAFSSGTGGTAIGTGETSIGTVSITPQSSSSKIQVIARIIATKDTGTTRRTVTVRVKRSTTQVGQDCGIFSQNIASSLFGPAVVSVIDTHGQTSAITYTLYALCDSASGATSERWSISAVELVGPKGDPGSTNLDGLTDVVITSAASGEYIRYNGTNWVDATIQAGDLPTAIDAAKIANGNVSNTEFQYLDGVTSAIQTQIDGKASTSHTHTINDLSDVTITSAASGEFIRYSGTEWVDSSIQAADLPTAIDAAKIANGTVSNTEFQYLDGVTSAIQTQLNGKAATSHTHAISDVTNLQTSLDAKVTANAAITGATKTKITYDAKGLVTAGADANLDDLGDVVITTPSTNQVLTYNGTNWVNAAATGGVSDGDKGDITVSNGGTTWTIDAGAVTYADIQNVAANSFLANATGTAATVQEIATTRIPLFASAITGTPSASTYLRGDGSWATVSGTGISTLNTLTDTTQSFAVGTSGTNFNISSATGVHTFNIPDASATARGLITTGTQTIAGAKTFSSALTVSAGGISVTSTSSNNTIAATTGTNTISASPSVVNGNVLIIRNTNTVSNAQGTLALDTDRNANDSYVDIKLASTNPKGIRIYSSNAALTATPDGAGFQMFSNNSAQTGQMYFDSGSNNGAFLSFRTAQAAGTITERMIIFANGNVGIGVGGTNNGFKLEVSGTARITGNLTISDGSSIIAGSTSGLKIGTATTQKVGFFNAAPIIQPTTAVAASTFVANTGTALNDASTFDGYTIAQVVKALRNTGLLA